MRGLRVDVYRAAHGGDCTNGGVTASRDSFILVDREREFERAPEVTQEDFDAGRVLFVDHVVVGEPSYFARPAGPDREPIEIDGHCGPMFGGNFVSTSDSRFAERFGDALRVHDRFEDWETHRRLSA